MKRIWFLVTLSLFLCSTASAGQGGGGESTKKGGSKKKEVTKKATSGTPSANTTPQIISEVKVGKELTLTIINLAGRNSHSPKAVAFSPNGRFLAVGDGNYATSSDDAKEPLRASASESSLMLWDTSAGGKVRALLGHLSQVNAVAFSPDSRILASGGQDRTVRLWDPLSATQLRVLRGQVDAVESVAFSPNGETLVSGGLGHRTGPLPDDFFTGMIKIWNVRTGILQHMIETNFHVFRVAFSPDGKTFAANGDGGGDGAKVGNFIGLWDAKTYHHLRSLEKSDVYYYHTSGFAFSPDGNILASCQVTEEGDGTVKFSDVASGKLLEQVKVEGRAPLAYSPDGALLAARDGETGIKFLNATTGGVVRALTGHRGVVYALAFSPDGELLASASVDTTVKLWEVPTGRELLTLIAIGKTEWPARVNDFETPTDRNLV
jgi:WD40 repeat protein